MTVSTLKCRNWTLWMLLIVQFYCPHVWGFTLDSPPAFHSIETTARTTPHSLAVASSTIHHVTISSIRSNIMGTMGQPSQSTALFSSASGYIPPSGEDESTKTSPTKPPLYPKAGDFVRFFDLDGGKEDGQVLVGRIRFIQKNMGNEGSGWTVELTEMEELGDGYYSDYGSCQRWNKGSTYRDLAQVSPLTASFVRSQDAYKVPTKQSTSELIVKAEQYDIQGYQGPFADPENQINQSVVEADAVLYQALKGKLLKYAAIAGFIGTLVADLTRGNEAAAIYFAGFLASLAYLVFLSLKTDTVGTEQAQFGKNLSNLRFLMPVLVLVGVALYNQSQGEANPVLLTTSSNNLFSTVTPSQFGAAILGFLTYRLPLFLTQVQDAFAAADGEEGGAVLPGSAGMAMRLAQGQKEDSTAAATTLLDPTASTVFVVSGPQATGRRELIQQLVEQGEGKFVTPSRIDKVANGAIFERLEQRGELLDVENFRYGLTKQAIIDAGKKAAAANQILVVDANVELSKKLAKLSGLRLVGVWVGLGSVGEFEERLGQQIDQGLLAIEEDETRESTIRGKIREIVKEIEYGISSGIFEFTVLNDDPVKSLQQLKDASSYVD